MPGANANLEIVSEIEKVEEATDMALGRPELPPGGHDLRITTEDVGQPWNDDVDDALYLLSLETRTGHLDGAE